MFESIGNFFKGIFSATTTMNNIFAFIATHLIYLLAGALVAFVIILIIMLIMKKIPNWIICTLVSIACIGSSFGIAMIVDGNQKKAEITNASIAEFNENLNISIDENYGNTNGGWTIPQIETVQNDDEAPLADDVVIELNIKDFGDYVDFYYIDKTETYQNAIFVKTANGLIYDGILNTSCGYRADYMPGWAWIFLPGGLAIREYDLNSFEWETEYKIEPDYKLKSRFGFGGYYDNLLTETRLKDYQYCFNNFWSNYVNSDKSIEKMQNLIPEYLGSNTIFFQKFGDCELLNTVNLREEPTKKIYNTFYTYLFNQMNGVENGSSKLIDVTHLMCKPIAQNLQANYPISEDAKLAHPEYEDMTNYGVYKCNIAVKCYKIATNQEIRKTSNADGILIENVDKDDYKTLPTIQGETLSDITISFINRNQSDLTDLDLEEYPITIVFKSTELDKTKKIVISDKTSLSKTTHILLNKSKIWKYEILSPIVVFEGYNGSFQTTMDYSNLTLNFEYYSGKIPVRVGLNLIGSLDITNLDLANNPTKIVLTNGIKTYQFVFDDNDLVDQYITQVVEPGNYNYSILSTELIFASETGTITLSTISNFMLFNYSQNINVVDCKISANGITFVPKEPGYFFHNFNVVILYKESNGRLKLSDYNDLASYLGLNVNSITSQVYIYGSNGKILYKDNSSDRLWTSFSCEYNFVENESYSVQYKIIDKDGNFAYSSDFLNFTYNSENGEGVRVEFIVERI